MPSEKRERQRAYRQEKVAKQTKQLKRTKRLKQLGGLIVVVGVVIGLVAWLSSNNSSTTTATSNLATTTVTPATTLSSSGPTTTLATTTTNGVTPVTAPAPSKPIAPTCPPNTQIGAPSRIIHFTKAPPLCISPTGIYDADVYTTAGTFTIQMNAAKSLSAVNNFVFLARYRYYNGVIFQRVIPGFVVQGGDPTGTGSGGPGYSFTGNTPPSSCQTKNDCYPLGSVAMANTGSPTSNGSQFFIVVGPSGEALPPKYTLFGKVISGMNVVQKIASEGNSNPQANGMPPKVTYHMISVTITQAN